MTLADARERLVQADIIAPTGGGHGFPVWLPFGTLIAERLEEIYLEELAGATSFELIRMPALLDSAQYRAALAARHHEYRNMYELELDGREALARPDNLAPAAAAIVSRQLSVPLVAQGSLYRAVTGALRPLVLDRHVWRATQVVHRVDAGEIEAAMELHLHVCSRLLKRLGLPALWVDKPALARHSKRSVFAYLCPSEDEVVGGATTFELDDALVACLGLSGGVLDFGFTARLIACVAAVHGDRSGFLCTSSLAPNCVVVGARRPADRGLAHRLAERLGENMSRVAINDGAWHRTLRINRRRGTPVLVLVDGASASQLITRFDDESVPLPEDAASAVADALARHDAVLASRAESLLNAAIRLEQSVRLLSRGASAEGWFLNGTVRAVGDVDDRLKDEWDFFARRRRQR